MVGTTINAESIDEKTTDLWHLSLNEDAPDTIVLLHGLGTCHAEWTFVWPHLSAYHLLIPDLNGHSKSARVEPTTISGNAEAVARLIRSHARGGKAHIVGLSMGGRGLPEDVKTAVHPNNSATLTNAIFGSIGQIKPGSMKYITVRTLVVAGGKMDAVEATRAQGRAMRESRAESRAVVVRKAGYGWSLQFPELFAQGLLAWIQKHDLPADFEELS